MIILFANRWDEVAVNFAKQNYHLNIRLMTCKDLSDEGWKIDYQNFTASEILLNQTITPVNQITGVISLATSILPQELVHIHDADKDYVASEMNAFFTYFFHQLNCKKVNQPVVGNFLGTKWRHEQWLVAAQKSGFKILPFCRSNYIEKANDFKYTSSEVKSISQLEGNFIGKEIEQELILRLKKLQELSGLTYQEIQYLKRDDSYYFLAAQPKVNLLDKRISETVLNYFNN